MARYSSPCKTSGRPFGGPIFAWLSVDWALSPMGREEPLSLRAETAMSLTIQKHRLSTLLFA
jgi:hypothetical protein